ncbi:MAG: hypothetical protein HC883_00650 [Bdellovibrionaceae bacterium]|nr:hypothetical protein [Pseudobdellovibrionaceae bacterium]
MAEVAAIGRANEITSIGPLTRLPGNSLGALRLDDLAAGEIIRSGTLAVNASAQDHWVAPYDCRITGGVFRVTTQQASANGSVVINKNGSALGAAVTVATTAVAGTLLDVTVAASGGTFTPAEAKLARGDLITFSRPNTGATGVVVGSLFIVPRDT